MNLSNGSAPVFTSTLSVALLSAVKSGAGIAVLPRYLGDVESDLQYLPMPDEPRETAWLTVHKDLRTTPRVRAVLDFLISQFEREHAALRGR